MYDYNYDIELYHHGIKGMKWGVRRFQNKDGTLTPAGKKRYDDDEKSAATRGDAPSKSSKRKVTRQDMLEKKYRDSGMSEYDAKIAAAKRIKLETTIAITAGVTVAACAAYYAKNKWAADRCDQILKAGTTFHNLDSMANARPGEHLYVNYRQNDTQFFRGEFALGKIRKSGQVFDHTLTAKEDIRIPSLNTRKSVFKQLYDSDEEFRRAFNAHTWGDVNEDTKFSSKLTYKLMWSKMGDKDNPRFNSAKHKYFEALRQKGYEAIVDEWDTNKGVYRSDAPLILLNTSSKSFGEMTIKELSAKDVMLAQANSRNYEKTRSLLTSAYLPHTNHFKESKRSLDRETVKNAKNAKYIDKALKEYTKTMTLTKDDNEVAKITALNRNGALMADIGKYMTKNEKLSYAQAKQMATAKKNAINNAHFITSTALMSAPLVAISSVSNVSAQNRYVRKYMEEHPNTNKTYEDIVNMYQTEQRS